MKYNWFALKLVIICVVVWIAQNIFDITDEFALVSADVLSRPWTIITHIFLHGSFQHLFFNMFALAMFGSILEKIIGGKKFLLVFFASGAFASLGTIFFYNASIGASGAIYGIFGVLAVIRPKMPVFAGMFVPMPMIVAVSLWAAGDLLGVFAPSETIAYASHLFGLFFGILYGFYIRGKYREERREIENRISERQFRNWEDEWVKLSDPYL